MSYSSEFSTAHFHIWRCLDSCAFSLHDMVLVAGDKRSCQELPLCQTEPTPGGSRTNQAPGQGHVNQWCWQHHWNHRFKNGTGVWGNVHGDEKECVREAALQTPRPVKMEEDVLWVPEQRFLCSTWWRPWWGRMSPYSPWWSMVDQIPTCNLWRTPHQHRWVPEGGSDSVGNVCWFRLPFIMWINCTSLLGVMYSLAEGGTPSYYVTDEHFK